jgi:acetolactate synthase I/II/III large subunit
MITYLVDSIHRQDQIRLISMHHEQAAAFAAEGVARMTGVPGVALATSGPGATNLITGIGSCYFDSTPAVFITGQVNRNEQKRDRPIRQLGFQETDIVSIVTPITKGAWRIESPEEVPARLAEAFALALGGRPGPVLLDIPMDVQRSEVVTDLLTRVVPSPAAQPNSEAVQAILQALQAAERPLILAGGGVRTAHAADLLRRFVERVHVPVVNTLMSADALPYDHPLRIGLIGTYGNRWANLALGQSDCLLVLGSRLDIRQTGSDTAAWRSGRTIYQVDCDPGEINNRVTGCYPVVADLAAFLAAALRAAGEEAFPERAGWCDEISELRRAWPDTDELAGTPGINPNQLMHLLSESAAASAAYVIDVGQHQMWAVQSLDPRPGQRVLTSGGMGAMGFALPAAIGASFAAPGRPVVAIAGDGGFQFNLQELQTIAAHRLPVKMVVVNNQCLGMVRQFQQSYFEERYQSTCWGYSAPNFPRVAEAFGIQAATVRAPEELAGALAQAWADPTAPFLLEVMVDMGANAYPKIAFGRPMTEMEPFARPLEVEST